LKNKKNLTLPFFLKKKKQKNRSPSKPIREPEMQIRDPIPQKRETLVENVSYGIRIVYDL